MRRRNNLVFIPTVVPRGPGLNPQLPGRVPQQFIEAMKLLQGKPADTNKTTPDVAAQRRTVQPNKWKSSFQPVDGGDNSTDKSAGSSERVELYDPYSPVLSDSDLERPDSSHCPSDKDNTLQRSLSPGRRCQRKSRWNCSHEDGQLFSPDTRPCESQGFSPGNRLSDRKTYSPDTESFDRPRHDNIGRPIDHRVCSPDRTIQGSSTQQFSTSYGGQRSNGEERMTVPEYRREVSQKNPAVRLSPSRLQREYHHKQGNVKTAQYHIKLSTEVTRNSQKIISMDKIPIACDLCEVELANGQELEDHLDSKSHWDTMEHIQQQNSYDDLAIAFLQEVMLYKSRQCSRAIQDSALQSLQENDHMTKVEIFHCAACDIFVSTSASSVQAHITSQGHLSKTKEFEVHQRRACLNKAETIMMELKSQFEYFMQGDSPFE